MQQIFIFGRSEKSCLAYVRAMGGQPVPGLVHLIHNLNWTKIFDLRFEPGDVIEVSGVLGSDMVERLRKIADRDGVRIGG